MLPPSSLRSLPPKGARSPFGRPGGTAFRHGSLTLTLP